MSHTLLPKPHVIDDLPGVKPLTYSSPGGFKPASTEVNFSPDKYRLLQRQARSV
ncbi:hypothetical protein CRE_20914 [Caenorhabditis remanei]|uniref:Uncharacterized protein n=1 Tax=Caenorhabditis remanei TaxID=31234 RepID=E3N3S4_CAERE|nr:hypothetical protein CRE_20914 [Caenorhabditis remanei]